MGLFKKETYNCVVCGKKVGKKALRLADGEKICMYCDDNVRSLYVEENVRTEIGYPKINISEMKIMQEFYAEAAKRSKQFVTTFYTENLCVDKEHGWFFFTKKSDDLIKHDLKYYSKPIEIFSVNDIGKISYRFYVNSDTRATMSFNFRYQLLPYIPYHEISFSGKTFETAIKFKIRLNEIVDFIRESFPNAILETPEDTMRKKLTNIYAASKDEINNLAIQRTQLNDQVDIIMSVNLPDICKPMAKLYLQLDNQLSNSLDLLMEINNFKTDSELNACKEQAKEYLSQMLGIYRELDNIIVKKLDKQALKMRKGK
jgi:hypothetical protein